MRSSAWLPVRVTLHNRAQVTVQGTVAVPVQGLESRTSSAPAAVYEMPVVLPALTTKRVTFYLPGPDLGNRIAVRFRSGRASTAASVSPTTFDDEALSVGAVTDDPEVVAWLRAADRPTSRLDLVQLSADTLDPVQQALASFDVIVLSHISSRLDPAQVGALERYVEAGGALMLVGGAHWQETLGSLPTSLLPGVLAGSRTVRDLSGLRSLAGGLPPGRRTVVSVLSRPRGTVAAGEAGVPLVVRDRLGRGQILYLAFDPAVDPIAGWKGAARLLSRLVVQAGVNAASRILSSRFQLGSPQDRTRALSLQRTGPTVPEPTSPSLPLLLSLIVLSVLVVGPLNLLVLHRLHRPELALVSIPTLALLCLGSTLGLVVHLKGNLTVLTTVGLVEMNGKAGVQTATMYTELVPPVRGDYRLVWNGWALSRVIPRSSSRGPSPAWSPSPVRFQEGARTTVDFPSLDMWSPWDVSLTTTALVPGTVDADLHLTPDGAIAGDVHNVTPFPFICPVLVAGGTALGLEDLKPGATTAVRIRPSPAVHRMADLLLRAYEYRSSAIGSSAGNGSVMATDRALTDRLRAVVRQLPELADTMATGGVRFLGWTEAPLGTFTVDGEIPQRRDLNLVIAPLSVRFPSGSFRLRPGTVSAHLVDVRLEQAQNGCCFDTSSQRQIILGPGGRATFQFDLPHARFRRLGLLVNVDGAQQRGLQQVFDVVQIYNWHTGAWTGVRVGAASTPLPAAERFVSSAGTLLVRLRATRSSGDLAIPDPDQDLQISGWATPRRGAA